ncbi:MAG: hypothetical protein KJ052_00720 [Candidatus Hydrogenedentes bacterium]|nr:hypothetical protein [Candidatus Hydrogenedentota bacterium]
MAKYRELPDIERLAELASDPKIRRMLMELLDQCIEEEAEANSAADDAEDEDKTEDR